MRYDRLLTVSCALYRNSKSMLIKTQMHLPVVSSPTFAMAAVKLAMACRVYCSGLQARRGGLQCATPCQVVKHQLHQKG